jgi:hypothetical protein
VEFINMAKITDALPTIPEPASMMKKEKNDTSRNANENNEVINMEQMAVVLNALQKAIHQKIYNADEIKTIFPIFNKLSIIVESMKRKEDIQKLYADVL